jgi:hypothetical protein
MSTETTNLGLKKETGDEFYNVETVNENWDKVDAAVALKETPAGAQEKVDAHANAADPHTEYIKKSLATAVNDFIVASGAGVFVKKTLAEVKAILGLGSAAYTASTAYATAAQGAKADNAATQASLDAHVANNSAHGNVVYTAGGTANAITINTGGVFKWSQGNVLKFKCTTPDNTAGVTITVDGISKGTLTQTGTSVSAGQFKAGRYYEIVYDPARDSLCFFLAARASGNATAPNVLAGKTASTDAGDIVGTMPNLSVGDIQSSSAEGVATRIYMAMPSGYVNGNGLYADDPDFIAANFPADKNIFGLQGSIPIRGEAVPNYEVQVGISTSGGNVYLMAPAGIYRNPTWIYQPNQNLIAANIKKDVTILGVTGTVEPFNFAAIGNVWSSTYYNNGTYTGGEPGLDIAVSITGLTFRPQQIVATLEEVYVGGNQTSSIYKIGKGTKYNVGNFKEWTVSDTSLSFKIRVATSLSVTTQSHIKNLFIF